MIKLLLLSLLLFSSLYANKVIYLNYDKVPKRVIKGEIFPISFKVLSTVKNFDDIYYEFSNSSGIEFLTTEPQREYKGKYFYDTFYLLSNQESAKLPDVTASLLASQEYNTTTIEGPKLNIITLNPKKNFINVIANEFSIQEYKTTWYDNTHNIVIIVATAKNSDIKSMHFNNVFKQGIESLHASYLDSKITYFVVIDKRIENFSFSYFNLLKNRFENITIPIIVEEDSVTTQTDLKPKDQSKEQLKMSIAAVVAFILFLIILWRRKYIYFILMIFPIGYIIYLAIPEKEICIKKGAKIRLLPVRNGTIFETTSSQITLLKEGSIKNFVKVKLQNEKIGWVKNEDICPH